MKGIIEKDIENNNDKQQQDDDQQANSNLSFK
jgi:hypothetical protein